MATPARIVVLASGRGSNLRALLQAAGEGHWPARVERLICNRPGATAIEVAHAFGVDAEVVDHQAFDSREAFDAELLRRCRTLQPDLIVLAGFMRVLSEAFVKCFEGRLINVHPSLLPAFAGLHTHRRALQAGVKLAGATVHYVTPELDHGPIIVQAAVPVRPDDDEARLADRVLQMEHRILPLAVGWHLRGELELSQGIVRHRLGAAQWFCAETACDEGGFPSDSQRPSN